MRGMAPLFTDEGLTIDKTRVTSTYFIPYREDLVRFDFEVDQEDEPLLGFGNII